MKSLSFLGLSKYSISADGRVYSHYSKRFLSRYIGDDGYHKANLTNDQGIVEYWRVPRLVGFAYCEGYQDGYVINHKDGDKLNDSASNLEWVTVSENTIHSVNTGLQTAAGKYDFCEISTIHEICRMLEEGYRKKDIADMLDVKVRLVTEIQNRTHWQFISSEYNIDYVKKPFRLSPEKVHSICSDLQDGMNLCQAAKANNVGTSTVHRIRQRQSYTDISKTFHW